MNIITKIESDHQEIRNLINKVDNVLDSTSNMRESQFNKLKSLVLTHHDAELSTLLNELTKHDKSRDKAMHLVEEHGEHKKVIDQLNSLDTESKDWVDHYKELRHDILHHIEEEEQELFEITKETLDEQQLEKLGNDMVLATAKISDRA
jgi:hemerythrin-like domain-containing protein